ncbi:MAG TPA: hypothetical protein VIO64_07420 [Pseudobacteroides sp.]|uniref:hypothetical protein n=1 Tax=Pseudobacteroides sp. TaxID=1968840 RepID=UPI002F94DA7F
MRRIYLLFFIVIIYISMVGCTYNKIDIHNILSYQLISDKELGFIKDMVIIDNSLYYLTKSELRVLNLKSNEDILLKKIDKLNKIYITNNTLWFGYSLLSGSSTNQLPLKTYLLKFDLKSKVFYEFDYNILKGRSINSIFDNGQMVLVGTDEGLFSIEAKQNKVTSLKGIHEGFSKKVVCITGNKNFIWISADNKLIKLDSELKNTQIIQCPWEGIGKIYLGNDKLWVDAMQKKLRGILFLDFKDNRWTEFKGSDWSIEDHIENGITRQDGTKNTNKTPLSQETETSQYVGKMWVDEDGVAWVYSNGIKWFSEEDKTWKSSILPKNIPFNITSRSNIKFICYDSGIAVFDRTKDEFNWLIKDVSIKKVNFDKRYSIINCIEGTFVSGIPGKENQNALQKKNNRTEELVKNKMKAEDIVNAYLKDKRLSYHLSLSLEEVKFGRKFYSLIYSTYDEVEKKSETTFFMVDSLDSSIFKLDQDDDYGDYLKVK